MEKTTLKKSRQRDAILANLMARKDHPTADMIYMDVRKEIPNISLGTVYRNLSLLADHGIILRLNVDGKSERFDAFTGNHYHFICKECGKVIDLPLPSMEMLNQNAQEGFSGLITEHSALFFGYCEKCTKQHLQ